MIIDDSCVNEGKGKVIIKDFMYTKSLSMIYGIQKTGKSYVCLYLSGCLTDGKNIAKKYEVKGKFSVLYFNGEMPLEELKKRVEKLKERYEFSYDNFIVVNKKPLKKDMDIFDYIRNKVEKYKNEYNVDIVIIDSISYYFSNIDIVKRVEANDLMSFLSDLALSYDIHILFVNHQKKTNSDFIGDRSLGSLVTNMIKIENINNWQKKCYLESSHYGLNFNFYYYISKNRGLIVSERKLKGKEGKKRIIIPILEKHEEIMVKDLFNYVKNEMSRATFFKILKELEREGIIKREGSTRNTKIKLIKEFKEEY